MLKLKIQDLIVLGLDKNNIRQLTEGKPIYIDMQVFGVNQKLTIMYKDTLQELKEDLEAILDLKLPDTPDLPSGATQDLTDQANALNQLKH